MLNCWHEIFQLLCVEVVRMCSITHEGESWCMHSSWLKTDVNAYVHCSSHTKVNAMNAIFGVHKKKKKKKSRSTHLTQISKPMKMQWDPKLKTNNPFKSLVGYNFTSIMQTGFTASTIFISKLYKYIRSTKKIKETVWSHKITSMLLYNFTWSNTCVSLNETNDPCMQV